MGTTDTRITIGRGSAAREQLLALLPVTERRLDLAGASTAVLEAGGPPMILLHGPGEFAESWLRVIPDLMTTHRIIAPDLPGHGASEVDGCSTLGWFSPGWPNWSRRPVPNLRSWLAARRRSGRCPVRQRARRPGRPAGPGRHPRAGAVHAGTGSARRCRRSSATRPATATRTRCATARSTSTGCAGSLVTTGSRSRHTRSTA